MADNDIIMNISKRVIFLSLLILFSPTSSAAPDQLNSAVNQQNQINLKNTASQKKIEKIADQTQSIFNEYKQTLRESENLRIYNNNLEKLIVSQKTEISSLNKQLNEIDATNQGIVPLMIRMVGTLEKFIELDVPFLLDERKNRIASLKQLLIDANITTSEKYRRIMEAYQIETEYGRTIEAYQGKISDNGNQRTVDYLRIGRLSLVYQTLDGKQASVWDHTNKSWAELSSDYSAQIKKGIRIAKKQSAPELLTLPISAKKSAQKAGK